MNGVNGETIHPSELIFSEADLRVFIRHENLFNLEIQDKQNTLNFVKEAFPDIWGAYLNIKNIGFSQLELED